MEAIYRQSALWIAGVSGNMQGIGSVLSQQMQYSISDVSGLGSLLGLLATTAILALAILAAGLFIQVVAFSRMFEIYVYIAVSPLPAAFFPLGNGDGTGFSRITARFIRGFAAVCLQGVIMILCLNIFGTIMATAVAGMTPPVGTDGVASVIGLATAMLLGSIVLVMSVAKAGSWAKSILDA